VQPDRVLQQYVKLHMNLISRNGMSLTSIGSEGSGLTKFENLKFILIKMYLNKVYMKVHIDKYLQPIQMGLKQGYALSLFFNFALEYTILGSP
jgi:hypothetical protein